jgi:hypothetical protein
MSEAADKEEDFDIVEVDELPVPGAEPPTREDDREDDEDDGDGHDDDDAGDDREDSRLADEDDGDDADSKRRHRQSRKQRQREARDRLQGRLSLLEQQNATLMQRLQAVEGVSATTTLAQVDDRLGDAQARVRQADNILAKALEAGAGDDFVEAQRMRDEAKADEQNLLRLKTTLVEHQKRAPELAANPQASGYASQWRQANPWYNPTGGDENSNIVNAIDNAMLAEGWNPGSEGYWSELTKRVNRRMGGSTTSRGDRRDTRSNNNGHDVDRDDSRRRAPPPQGRTREHVPPSTRREVAITPERKQALIDAGKWDDPAARKRALKYYADYDRDNPPGR